MQRFVSFLTIAVFGVGIVGGGLADGPAAAEVDIPAAINTIRNVGAKAEGAEDAQQAWKVLSQASEDRLIDVLEGFDDAGPLAVNYLRAAVDAIAARTLRDGRRLPADALEEFVLDRSHHPRARRLAYEWLVKVDPQAELRLIPGMTDDPSLELRRDAVSRLIEKAEKLLADGRRDAATEAFTAALTAARDLDQIQDCHKQLAELGKLVDLPRHFGFVVRWKLIGPFDNSEKTGFDVAYPPEKRVDLDAAYQGKEGEVRWVDHTTPDQYGIVDFNKALGKHMGVVGYAFARFDSDTAREVDLRLGCINASKLWVNGRQLGQHEVYHAGTSIDQYVARAKLNKGANTILVKVCQNEQTESWAQRWQFQLRVCDRTGTAILATNRPAATPRKPTETKDNP